MTSQDEVDLRVDHACVVTMDDTRRVFADGGLAVKDGRFLAVGPTAQVAAAHPSATEVADGRGRMLLPGLIDSHCHLGLDSLSVCRQQMEMPATYPETAVNGPFNLGGDLAQIVNYSDLTPFTGEVVYWAALNAAIQCIRSGVTQVIDGGSPDPAQVVAAVLDSGLRAGIGLPVGDLRVREDGRMTRRADADAQLTGAEAFCRESCFDSERLTPWLAPLVGVGCSDELLRGVAELAARKNLRVFSHLATLRAEDAFCQEHFGLPPVERFEKLGLLNRRLLGIHMGWVRESDITRLAVSGTCVAHCPQAAARLAHGIYSNGRIPGMVDAGVPVGIGVDTTPLGDYLQMLHVASSVPKDVTMDVTVLDAPCVLEMATRRGALCSGELDTGQLCPGNCADFITVNIERAHYLPGANPVRVFVEASRSDDIEQVYVAGRCLLRDGALQTIDEDEVRGKLSRCANPLIDQFSAG